MDREQMTYDKARDECFKQYRETWAAIGISVPRSGTDFKSGFDAGYEFAVKAERKRIAQDLTEAHDDDCSGYHCVVCHFVKTLEAE